MKTTLFDPPLAHTADPATSYDAAENLVNSGKLAKQEAEVLHVILWYGRKFSAKQLSIAASRSVCNSINSIDYFQIQRRLSGLRRKGKIGRVRKDGGLCCGEHPNTKFLVTRNHQCVWKLK